jgi:PAS domain S-box-containing protein
MKVDKIVITLFVGALVAVVSSAYYARENFNSAENSGSIGRHTHFLIDEVQQVEYQATELENASDKYILTGESYYAALARQNESVLNKIVQGLTDSVKDTPTEMQKIKELVNLIASLEKTLKDTLRLQPANADIAGIASGSFRQVAENPSRSVENSIDNIVAKGNEIIGEETRQLEIRRLIASQTRLNLVRATYYTDAAALIFIIILLLWLNRDILRRQSAEAKIRENEVKLRDMLEGVGDVIYSSDFSGRFTFINARLGSLTGYTIDELLGKHFTFLVHPDWADKVKEFYFHQFHNRVYETRFEFPILTKQGQTKWVEQNVVMITKGKMVDGFQCVVRDITQRKNSEEEIRRTNQFLDSVLENIPDMIFIKDARDLRFLRFNKAGEKLLGYLQEDMIGKNDYDFFPKDQADFFTLKDREVLNSHKGIDIQEEPIKTKHGTSWLHTKKIPVYNTDGKPQYLLGISADITEKKKTEDTIIELNKSLARYVAELEESQRFYKTIARNFPDGTITVLNRNLDYLFVDGGELSLEGLDSGKLLGTPYLNRFPEQLRNEIKNNLLQILNGNNTSFEVNLTGGFYVIHGAPMENAEGGVDEILLVKQNISKLKEAEANMKTALEKEKLINEMKSRFVSLASHEFRTPLSTILSSTEFIAEYIERIEENPVLIREKNLHHLKRIKASIQNMVNILNSFLSLDQLEQGKTLTNPTEFDMEEFSAEAIGEIQGKLKPGQRIEFSCEPSGAKIFTDRPILKNIILNLLANAIKYSPENRVVKYIAIVGPEGVEIIIEDQGIGIPETDQANLFERFYRAKNTMNIEGTGLGLNIVKKYIDLLEGSISFISHENKGTIFKIFIANTARAKENNLIKHEIV